MLEKRLKEYIRNLVQEMDEELDEITTTANIDGFDTPYAFLNKKSKKDKEKRKKTATMMGYTIVGEGRKPKRPINRWLELKNDETRTPNQKLALGLKELKYQLAEVEMFFRWYNKIRSMNELNKDKYWKRTNTHIYKIKERLINIVNSIKELDQ
jgi:hypothetical protein|tara:strand:+ start:134 stop:595 length:462 start_codon:yes stop_codon:yes gene_type:complete